MSHPVIVAARRTACGKFGGLLAKVPAPQLGGRRCAVLAGYRRHIYLGRAPRGS